MKNDQIKKLCMDLLVSDSEDEVISLLKNAGFWEDSNLWRLYGDKEGNFAQAGNQQALPEAALVEKLVNCCDARLMCECLLQNIGPESVEAPVSVRDAVTRFFEGRRAENNEAGTLANWPAAKRLEQSKFITIAATGGRPTKGHKSKNMCLTIVDQAEGQSPNRLPKTVLSLNEKNKQRIRFVQGKFNMGGSGALRFCGSAGLQLVISKRHPKLAERERAIDETVDQWVFTVVRREEPSTKSGEPVNSEFTYLAPVTADSNPRKGGLLGFSGQELELMPEQDRAYARRIAWGTAIKLYEYDTSVGQSNVLLPDGLMYALERLLPEVALPVRIHECRSYGGAQERSFETTISGLVVRLEEGRGDNLEIGFPDSAVLKLGDMKMTARIYAFKEGRGATYLKDEGVIFQINGQAHGYLPKSLFSRPKAVGLSRLRDSLLVLVDCSGLSARQREDLFMSSRDRLSKKPIRYEIEAEIEELLRTSPKLRKLQQERREHDVETKLMDERPLEEVLGKIFTASPSLKLLFLKGQRLARPFATGTGEKNGGGGGVKPGAKEFKGLRHPTYFRILGAENGKEYTRHCEIGRRCRIKFETDVENGYFERPVDKGDFDLVLLDHSESKKLTCAVTLDDGIAHLSLTLPAEVSANEELHFQSTVGDPTLVQPFVNPFKLIVEARKERSGGPNKPRPPRTAGGDGDSSSESGIELPPVFMVHEGDERWIKYKFTGETSCHVIPDTFEEGEDSKVRYTFYINADNTSLKTEMKYGKQDSRLLEAKFKYGNVLLGLALLHDDKKHKSDKDPHEKKDDDDGESVEDRIRNLSRAVAPVLIPIIDQLSALDEDMLTELSAAGEDA